MCVAAWVLIVMIVTVMRDLSEAAGNIVKVVSGFFGFSFNLPKAMVSGSKKIRNLMERNETTFDAVINIVSEELKIAATSDTGLDLISSAKGTINDLMSDVIE